MMSWESPRCDGVILCRLTPLELVDNKAELDECADRCSRYAVLALCASSSFSACREPRRYEGTKNGGAVAASFEAPYPPGPRYEGVGPLRLSELGMAL